MKSLGSSYRINIHHFNESSCRSYQFFENIDEVATVKILLEHGADLHTKDVTGKLHTTIYNTK